VLTNNFHEYGLTGSGIINTPRSGSNETTGEVFLLTDQGHQLMENLVLPKETYQETK
jgi:hypothetical protein